MIELLKRLYTRALQSKIEDINIRIKDLEGEHASIEQRVTDKLAYLEEFKLQVVGEAVIAQGEISAKIKELNSEDNRLSNMLADVQGRTAELLKETQNA